MTADLHISDTAPVAWDPYLQNTYNLYQKQESLLNSIRAVQEQCSELIRGKLSLPAFNDHVPVIVAGDIYHKSSFKRQRCRVLVEQYSVRMNQWWTIFGNHDACGCSNGMTADDSYCQGVLNGAFRAAVPISRNESSPPNYYYQSAPSISRLAIDNELSFGPGQFRLDFQFSNWDNSCEVGNLDAVPEDFEEDAVRLALIGIGHGYVRRPEDKAPTILAANEVLRNSKHDPLRRYDYLLFGDNHQHFTFTRGKRQFVSIGTPNPRRINEMNMKPAVILICMTTDFDNPQIQLVRVALDYQVEWTDSKTIAVIRKNEHSIDQLSEHVRSMGLRAREYARNNITDFFKAWVGDHQVPEEVAHEMSRLLRLAHESVIDEEEVRALD